MKNIFIIIFMTMLVSSCFYRPSYTLKNICLDIAPGFDRQSAVAILAIFGKKYDLYNVERNQGSSCLLFQFRNGKHFYSYDISITIDTSGARSSGVSLHSIQSKNKRGLEIYNSLLEVLNSDVGVEFFPLSKEGICEI